MFNLYSLPRFDVVKSRISLTLFFWSDSLIVFFFVFLRLLMLLFRIYEFTLTRNFNVAAGEEFQFDIDVIKWLSNESDDYFWPPRRRCPTRVNKRVRERRQKRPKRKSSNSWYTWLKIVSDYTQKRPQQKQTGERTKAARAVFVKFIFHRGYNFST